MSDHVHSGCFSQRMLGNLTPFGASVAFLARLGAAVVLDGFRPIVVVWMRGRLTPTSTKRV